MEFRRVVYKSFFVLAIFILILNNSIHAQKYIKLKNGSKALLYLPKKFDKNKRYPAIIAIQGKEQPKNYSYNAWKPVADSLEMILVCYNENFFIEKAKKKNAKNLLKFLEYLDRNFRVDRSKSFVAGFASGGTFAIDLGINHPNKFPNIISIFGFYDDNLTKRLAKLRSKARFKYSRFFFITGNKDITKLSLIRGTKVLRNFGIKARLKIFPNLYQSFPSNLDAELAKINAWAFRKK